MDCDDRQEQVSLLFDGELEAGLEAGVFRHLADCADCRAFHAAAARLRRAARLDAEEAGREADQVALPRPQVAAPSRRARPGVAAWRLPVPVAVALAVALLAGGALVGAGLGGGRGVPAVGRSPVVVICSLPQVEVR